MRSITQTNRESLKGHLSVFGAYFIFGINLSICKNIANTNAISPLDLFCFRSIGACILFWLISLFMPSEKVEKHDFIRIFAASMIGLFITQMLFLKSITCTRPIDAAILTSLTPIMTMVVAAIYLKEPISFKKVLGIIVSLSGAMILIFNMVHSNDISKSTPLGLTLMILNCLCFATYLGIFKPLIAKYSVVTFMKWMFLFATICSVPLNIKSLVTLDYGSWTHSLYKQIAFVIVFATFIAYFLIPIGQKILRPTIVSMYAYVQPIVASLLSIYIGLDTLSWQKVAAAILVFSGVYIVTRSRAATHNTSEIGIPHKRWF